MTFAPELSPITHLIDLHKTAKFLSENPIQGVDT